MSDLKEYYRENANNLKFIEDTSLANVVYNIDLYVKLLNILQDILCPIQTKKDFEYVMQFFDEIKCIKTELDKNNIQQTFLHFHQFQESEKVSFYIEKITQSFNSIYIRWQNYYNETIFIKAQRDYIYWNESSLKPIINQTDSEFLFFKKFLKKFKNETQKLLITKTKENSLAINYAISENSNEAVERKIDVQNKYWFIVGLKLATGELQKLYKEANNNATRTAIKLGNKNLRPYISESMANTNGTDKNIFKRKRSDIDLILNYCKENNIIVCSDFMKNI